MLDGPGVGVRHVLLEIAILIRLRTGSVEDGVVVAHAGNLHLDAAAGTLDLLDGAIFEVVGPNGDTIGSFSSVGGEVS